jgi:amino acid transporter
MGKEERLESQIEKDIRHLYNLGYAQELYRTISGFSNFAITFSVISVLSGLLFLFGYGLSFIGPFSIWTWVVVGFFQILLALSLGEIASIYPLTGGVYKWTGKLAGQKMGWFCGWFSVVGWLACTAGIEFGMAIFLVAYLGLPGDNIWIVLGCASMIVLLHGMININGIRLVAWLNDFSVFIHIVGVVLVVSLLFVFARNNSISHVLSTGGLNHGTFMVSFIQALLMSAWTLTAFDAAANVSEESINPSKVVPWGMLSAVVLSVVLGILLLLSLYIAMPPVEETLAAKEPAAIYVIYQGLGEVVGRFVTAFILIAQFTAGLSSQAVLVRVLYSFSRDEGLPFSGRLKKVSRRYGTPVNSIVAAVSFTLLLCFFRPVLSTITSISTMGLYFSYAIVLGAAVFNHQKIRNNQGPFHLGRWSFPLQTISFVWAGFISAIMIIPPFGENAAIFFAVFGAALIYNAVFRKTALLPDDAE